MCFYNYLPLLVSRQAAERAGGGEKGAKSAASTSLLGMSLEEAKQILNVTNISDAEVTKVSHEEIRLEIVFNLINWVCRDSGI